MLTFNMVMQLISFVTLLSLGQVLFKKAALSSPAINSFEGLSALANNIWFWLALVLYGTATLLWIIILQKVNLSIAYPFSALGFIIVPMAAWLVFNERISMPYMVGTALIIIGLLIISSKA